MKIGLKFYLRTLLSAFILVPAVTILIVGTVSIFTFAYSMMTEEVGTVSYAQSSGLMHVFDEYTTVVTAVSELPPVQSTARGLYANVQAEIDEQLRYLAEETPYILDAVIVDPNGVVAKDYKGREIGSIYANHSSEIAALGRHEIYISDITVASEAYDGETIFYMTKQIRYGDAPAGYLTLVVSAEAFSAYLSGTEFFEAGRLALVDTRGTAVGLGGEAFTRYEDIGNSALKEHIGTLRGTSATVNGLVSASTTYQSFEAGGYVGVYSAIGATGWHWLGYYPEALISDMVFPVFLTGLIAVCVITLIFMIVMIFISRHAIDPMLSMIVTMKAISAGDHDARFTVSGKNEFAQMSVVFNEMIGEVMLSEELHRSISEISDNILFEWDFGKGALYVSDNFLQMFEIDPTAATLTNGEFLDSLMDRSDAEHYQRDISRLLKEREAMYGEYQVSTKSGSLVWVSVRAHCVTNRLGDLLRVIGVIANIDSEKKLTLQLSERASYDFLSQLYNRSTFERELVSELERDIGSKIGIIFIDVDDFKFINDRYGHSVGDEVIKHVAYIVRDKLGRNGFAGRFGGDEFVMCVTDPDTVDNIEALAQSLIDCFDEGYYSESAGVLLKIKASAGISLASLHGRDATVLVGAADEAMYFVKKNGKSNYHMYNPDDSSMIDMMHTI